MARASRSRPVGLATVSTGTSVAAERNVSAGEDAAARGPAPAGERPGAGGETGDVAASGASVATAAGGMESEDAPASAAVLSAEVASAPTGASLATRPRGGGSGVVAEPAREAGGARPLGDGMASDGAGASTLGDALAAVQVAKGAAGGGSALVAPGAESVIGSVGSTADGGVPSGGRSTRVPATTTTRTEVTSAARLAGRVQSNRGRWTRVTSVAVTPGTTLSFVGATGGSIRNSDRSGSGANSSSPPVEFTNWTGSGKASSSDG